MPLLLLCAARLLVSSTGHSDARRLISAVHLKVCLSGVDGPSGATLPWELETEGVSHFVQMVQHLRTRNVLCVDDSLRKQKGLLVACECLCVYLVQHGSGVCRRHAEASSGLCDRRGWEADYHHADFPPKHFSRESPDPQQEESDFRHVGTNMTSGTHLLQLLIFWLLLLFHFFLLVNVLSNKRFNVSPLAKS